MNYVYFLLPFLDIDSNNFENEQIILSCLALFGMLLKSDDIDIMNFFTDSQVVISLLKIIENDKSTSKLIATCTLQKILSGEKALNKICDNEILLSNVIN